MTNRSSTPGQNHQSKNKQNANQRNSTPKRGRGGQVQRHEKRNGEPSLQTVAPVLFPDLLEPPPPVGRYGQPPPSLLAATVPPPQLPMATAAPKQTIQLVKRFNIDNFPTVFGTHKLEGGFEVKLSELQNPKAFISTVTKMGSGGPQFVLSALLHVKPKEATIRETVKELMDLIKQQQTEHSRIDPMNKASIPFLKDNGIVPLDKVPESFPDAVYYCEQCDYHITNILHARIHLDSTQDARHSDIQTRTSMREAICRSFPALLPNQLTAIEKVLSEASAHEKALDSDEPFSLSAYATKMQGELLEVLSKIPTLEGKEVTLEQFGSVLLGLDLPHSDVNYCLDVLDIDDSDSLDVISTIFDTLQKFQAGADGEKHADIVLSEGAFPRISFTLTAAPDRNVKLVLSWRRHDSVKFTRLVSLYLFHQPKLVELIRLIRKWARVCNMFGAPTGLNKHGFDLMVVHFLQQRNKLTILHEVFQGEEDMLLTEESAEKVKNMVGVAKKPFNVAELFVEFFKYYTEHRNEVVQIIQQAPLLRKETKWNNKVFQIIDPIRNENVVSFSKHFQPFFFNCILLTFVYYAVPRNKDGPIIVTTVYQKLQESPRKKRKRDREAARENGGHRGTVRALGADQQTPGKMEAHERRWKAEGKGEGEDAAEFVIKKADEALTTSKKRNRKRRKSKKRDTVDSDEEEEEVIKELPEHCYWEEPLTLKDFPDLVYERVRICEFKPDDAEVDDPLTLQYSRRTMNRIKRYVEPHHFTDEMRRLIAKEAEILLDVKPKEAPVAAESSQSSLLSSENEWLTAAREILGPDANRNRIYLEAARLKINSTKDRDVTPSAISGPPEALDSESQNPESKLKEKKKNVLKKTKSDKEDVLSDSEANGDPEEAGKDKMQQSVAEDNIWMKRAREKLGPDAKENEVLLLAARLKMSASYVATEANASVDWMAMARKELGPEASDNRVLLKAAILKITDSKEKAEAAGRIQERGPLASSPLKIGGPVDGSNRCRAKNLKNQGPDDETAKPKVTSSVVERCESVKSSASSIDWMNLARQEMGPEVNEDHVLILAARLKIASSKPIVAKSNPGIDVSAEGEEKKRDSEAEDEPDWLDLAREKLGPEASENQILRAAALIKISSTKAPEAAEKSPLMNDAEAGITTVSGNPGSNGEEGEEELAVKKTTANTEAQNCYTPTVASITTHFEDLNMNTSIDQPAVIELDDGEESALPDDFVFPPTTKATSLEEASTQEDEKEVDAASGERICFEEFFITVEDTKRIQEHMKKAEAWSPEEYDYSFDKMENYTGGYMPDVKCMHCDSNKHDADNCPQMKVPDIEEISYVRPENEWKEMDEIIEEYYQKAKVNDERRARIMKCLKKIENNLADKLPGARLEVFGSLMNGFGGANSDADICFRFESDTPPPEWEAKDVVKTINDTLRQKMKYMFCQAILGAKVPIVKFTCKVDRDLAFEGDISYYNTLALSNTRMLKAYTEWAPDRLPQLGLYVKNWAKACDIGDASKGSLSSYSYIIMMIHYLQNCEPPVLPRLQEEFKTPETKKEEHGEWDVYFHKEVVEGWSQNKQSVAQLFVGFLDYFSRFDYKTQVIQIRRKKPLLRAEKKWNRPINLEDPFDLKHNLGSGVTAKMFVFILKSIRISRSVFMKPAEKEWLSNLSVEILKACRAGNAPADRQCHRCHRVGHIADGCPNKLFDRDRKMYNKERKEFGNNRNGRDGGEQHQQQYRGGDRRESIGGRDHGRDQNRKRNGGGGAPWKQGSGMSEWNQTWEGFRNTGTPRRNGGGRMDWRDFDRNERSETPSTIDGNHPPSTPSIEAYSPKPDLC